MAMQAGMGLSKIIILIGAGGYFGTTLTQKGKLADLLRELQELVKGSADADGDTDYSSEGIAAQVQRLATEVRHLASSRQITVLNGGSSQSNLSSLIVPAAAVGAVGYGYMWWKGLSFSDLMYVTKHNMAVAVTNLTKHLDHVTDALAATKRHLTQRIENLDGKLDDQIEISKLLRNEVTDLRDDLSKMSSIVNDVHRIAYGLVGRIDSLEDKQDLGTAGVMYLCSVANGSKMKMPERLQEEFKIAGNTVPSIMGLKDIADSLFSENNLLTDGNTPISSDKFRKPLIRASSVRR